MIGCGGLGCSALQYLAAAGIGKLLIMDYDRVELSNMNRQVLHSINTINMFKVFSAE